MTTLPDVLGDHGITIGIEAICVSRGQGIAIIRGALIGTINVRANSNVLRKRSALCSEYLIAWELLNLQNYRHKVFRQVLY